MMLSDTGADFGERAEAEMPAFQPIPEQQPETCTPVIQTETTASMKPAHRGKKESNQKKSGSKLLPSKRPRISLNGGDTGAAPLAPSGSVVPGATQSSELMVVETKSAPFTPSRCGTPLRESARAAKLLLTSRKSNN